MNIPLEKYEVGYGRPPMQARWKKGQCGNPNRIRKRTSKPVVDMIDEFFASEIPIVENGISGRRSAFEIIFLKLWSKMVAGNKHAMNVWLKYSEFAAKRGGRAAMEIEVVEDDATPEAGNKNG